MKYLVVKNFDRFQHYRERNPPWIKLHSDVLTDVAFLQLPEAAQAQLMKLWILASQFGHPLPNDPKLLAGKIGATGKFHLALMISAGFLIPCKDVASSSASAFASNGANGALASPLAESSASRARARADPPAESEIRGLIDDDFSERDFSASEPALTALYLTIWANKAVAERWGEQPSPYTQVGAVELAGALATLGVEWPVARLSIYRQCRDSKQPRPPRSQNYFRRGIEDDWHAELARRATAASGEVPPPIAASPSRARARKTAGESTYENALRATEDA